jgi:hypothetical protein
MTMLVRFIAIAALIAAALLTGCAAVSPPGSDLATYSLATTRPSEVLSMREGVDGALLFSLPLRAQPGTNLPATELVYSYLPTSGKFVRADVSAWSGGGNPIVTWASRYHRSLNQRLKLNAAYELQFRDQPVRTAQKKVLELPYVGKANLVAVLTCAAYRPPGGFFGGPEIVRGPYYHQLFSSDDGQPRGPAIRLPFPADSGRVKGRSSPDGRYVVYVDGPRSSICFVPVELSE